MLYNFRVLVFMLNNKLVCNVFLVYSNIIGKIVFLYDFLLFMLIDIL